MTYEEAKANEVKLRYEARKRGKKFSLWKFKKRKLIQPNYRKNYNHQYYLSHKESMNARSKKWVKEHREYGREYRRRKKINENIS